jgi:O-antigen/teichoic acid export membrane protein
MLFSMMGITTIGIREIAATKNDDMKMSQAFTSLVALNSVFTLVSLTLLVISIYIFPQFYEHRGLMMVGAMKLLANTCLLEWLFTGLEKFRYITIRTIIVRILYVIAVFLFVRQADDYPLYFFLTSMMVVLNALVNLLSIPKHIRLNWREIRLWTYLKPVLIIGLYTLLTSMYTTFNVVFLGFVSDKEQVGFYSTATKLFTIIIAVYTAFTTVMLPRMSQLMAEKKTDEFHEMIRKSFNALLVVTIPLITFSFVFSNEIVLFISGSGYEGAYLPTRIVMPLIFVIGYSQILIIQILMPLKADRYILANSCLGAIVGIIGNIVFTAQYYAIGASITWVISELCVMIAAQYRVSLIMGYRFPTQEIVRNIISYLPAFIICMAISNYVQGNVAITLLAGGIVIIIYAAVVQLTYLRNSVVMDTILRFQQKRNKL